MKSFNVALDNNIFGYDAKSTANKSKNQVGLYQTRTLLISKKTNKKVNLQDGRKCLQNIYSIRDWYSKCFYSYNSITRKLD